MVKEIPLQNGMVALVDDEDFERVSQFSWYVQHDTRKTSLKVMARKADDYVLLSRFIVNLSKDSDEQVSFKDHNPLNFQKENLIIGDAKTVTRMRKGHRDSSSKYKGVTWDKSKRKWVASIFCKKRIYLGGFDSEEEAAKTYNEAAIKLFGEYAYQNVIGEDNNAKTFQVDKVIQKRSNSKTGLRGVRKSHKSNTYHAQLMFDKNTHYLGSFKTPEEAAKAYDQKAYELHGDKAILNFPELISEYKSKNEIPYC